MAKYLVTGAAGFIASRVIEMLLDQDHEVYGVDNLNDAYDVRMKEYRLSKLQGRKGFAFQRMDISDREAITDLLGKPGKVDGVINLAARAGVRSSISDPWVYMNTNILGTLNLVEYCHQLEIPKLILASTSSLVPGYRSDAFHGNSGYQSADPTLCCFKKRCRGPLLYLPLSLWSGCDDIQVLYCLWSGRSSRYGHVSFYPVDQ